MVFSLFWAGLVDDVGIHSKGTVLNLGTLPVAIGLYGYCYSGHAVFPNIYTSMAQPSRFPTVLLAWYLKLLKLPTSSQKLNSADDDFNLPGFIFAWFCYPCSFSICTLMYAGVAYMGYTMFGESTESQFTLNLPQDLAVSKVAVWTTVCSPVLTKIYFSCSVCSLPLI